MPKFNDRENSPPAVPEGDYNFTVISYDKTISDGKKTGGADKFDLCLELNESHGRNGELTKLPPGHFVYDSLIDHPSIDFRIDTFIKCCGVKIPKGTAFEFDTEYEGPDGDRINPLGLRGTCSIKKDSYTKTPGATPKITNKVAVYYTDRAKLAPVKIEKEPEPF